MKKSNLIKVVSILLVSVMVIMFSSSVFAANNTSDDGDRIDLTESIGGNKNNNNSGNTNSNNNNNNNGNTNNNNANTNNNNSNKANNNANNNNSNNNSVYNNNNLPKTGISDSIPVAMLIVIFGISAVYAYKKVKDYRNI